MEVIWDGRIRADARALPIADESVQCVVTSPPYWGLRSYGHAGEIGQERTLPEYLDVMRAVFAEVWRVLRPDGTLWLNLGDCYAGSWGSQGRQGRGEMTSRSIVSARQIAHAQRRDSGTGSIDRTPGLKAKDLCGIPWRVAFMLQADGWFLRSDIVWQKPNPLPESVQDRPTKSHEYLFLMSKSAKYQYDIDAIREPLKEDTLARYQRGRSEAHKYSDGGPGGQTIARSLAHMATGDSRSTRNSEDFRGGEKRNRDPERSGTTRGKTNQSCTHPNGRNKRSVWSIGTTKYSGAHYATFPPALVEPCILAGSRPGDVVLDPFAGSGAVAMVAERLGRRWLSVDLGYQDLQAERLSGVQRELVGA